MTDKPKMAPRGAAFQPRPAIIPKADFVTLAEMAYRLDHKGGLARQMGEKLIPPVSEKSCQRWLDKDGPPPPEDVLKQTLDLAKDRHINNAMTIDRVDQLMK